MMTKVKSISLLTAVALSPLIACDAQVSIATPPAPVSAAPVVQDIAIAEHRADLLELAFETASAIPHDPHIKDRSRAQEVVVTTCFELDQPLRALRYADGIDNWRRGAAYADFAFYGAERGDTSRIEESLAVADAEAARTGDWRRDRIMVKIAKTRALMGHVEAAASIEANLDKAELGKVDIVRAGSVSEESLDAQMKALGRVVEGGDFDGVRNALWATTRLYDRFYDDPGRRTMIRERIQTSWSKIPIMIRIELLEEMASLALAHDDQAEALSLVKDAQFLLDGSSWLPEHSVPLAGRLARLRFLAGDTESAREQADAAVVAYHDGRGRIFNIYRAGALRPIAEAYQSMGETDAALAVYRLAIEEGIGNPNSRPRAEDLSATCCSMARTGVEPDAALWARLHEIRDGLGRPW